MSKYIVVIDDMPEYAEIIEEVCDSFYLKIREYEVNIKKYVKGEIYNLALIFLESNYLNTHIIFTDHDLKDSLQRTGLDILTKIHSISNSDDFYKISSHVFCVLHSIDYKRFSEHQKEKDLLYNHFVNSGSEEEIKTVLELFENKILPTRLIGNPLYLEYMQNTENTFIGKQRTNVLSFRSLMIEVSMKEVLFLLMDKTIARGDYYFIYYRDEKDGFKRTDVSIHINSTINQDLDFFRFFEAKIIVENIHTKVKINPLWISNYDFVNNVIKLLLPNSTRFEFNCEIKNQPFLKEINQLPRFFQ
jgi:hypothetical protein